MFEYVLEDEQKIATKLVDTILEAGHMISVIDGEEVVVRRSTDRAEILEAMASTDSDTLVIRDSQRRRIGSVTLIWGNGCDLISDNTVDPKGEMEALLAPAMAVAREYEVAG